VANVYRATEGGSSQLRYRTPILRYGLVAAQIALWALAARSLVRLRRRALEIESGGPRPAPLVGAGVA